MRSANVHLTFKLGVIGLVTFTQADDSKPIEIRVMVTSMPNAVPDDDVEGLHGIRINTYGDISGGARTTGPIFNPNAATTPPIGQLESFEIRDGNADSPQKSNRISLFDGENSIIGRSVVVYKHTAPDYGKAIAWGIIGISQY